MKSELVCGKCGSTLVFVGDILSGRSQCPHCIQAHEPDPSMPYLQAEDEESQQDMIWSKRLEFQSEQRELPKEVYGCFRDECN